MSKKFIASLNRDVTIDVVFTSKDAQSGMDFDVYTVKSDLKKGNRAFKTKRAALQWVDNVTKDHGADAATYIGKAA